MQACLQKARRDARRPQTQQDGGRLRRRQQLRRRCGRQGRTRTGSAFQKCLPASLRRFRTRFTAPSQTLQAGAEPAADEHLDDRIHDRRRRPDKPEHGCRHDRPGDEGQVPLSGRRHGSARRDELRREAFAQGRLEAEPQRHVVHGRRARQPAARRPERRRLPAAQATADAREREEPRERRPRAREVVE